MSAGPGGLGAMQTPGPETAMSARSGSSRRELVLGPEGGRGRLAEGLHERMRRRAMQVRCLRVLILLLSLSYLFVLFLLFDDDDDDDDDGCDDCGCGGGRGGIG
eukprot:743746-Rhodomonas_salina.2